MFENILSQTFYTHIFRMFVKRLLQIFPNIIAMSNNRGFWRTLSQIAHMQSLKVRIEWGHYLTILDIKISLSLENKEILYLTPDPNLG